MNENERKLSENKQKFFNRWTEFKQKMLKIEVFLWEKSLFYLFQYRKIIGEILGGIRMLRIRMFK